MSDFEGKPSRINREVSSLGFDLVKAAERGRAEEVKALMAAGASPSDWVFFGETAAHHAARFGHEECLAAMIEKVDGSTVDDRGRTPLMRAIDAGCEGCARMLLGKGGELLRDEQGESAKDRAEARGWDAIVESLERIESEQVRVVKGVWVEP